MPGFIQNRFLRPETFRRIRPDLLCEWLRQWDGYFKGRGMVLPGGEQLILPMELRPGGSVSAIDYDALARIFMEPTPDIPSGLVEGIHLVHQMAMPTQMDRMVKGASDSGLTLDLAEDATAEDVAIKMLMVDPGLLEDLHNKQQVTRPRGFEYFSTNADPIPQFPPPTLARIRELEERLGRFYVAWRRGPGVRVFPYCQQNSWNESPEWLFLVRHGAPMRREEVMENGEPASLLFRPRKYAVLKYDTGRGEIGVYSSAERERKILLSHFGACLFGRSDFFPNDRKFDLSPLIKAGRACLAFNDVPGIEHVNFTEVETFQRKVPWRRTLWQAGDIFELLEANDMQWPTKLEEITKATFAVKFWREKRARRVTIVPCNKALYSQDEYSSILEKWMVARAFIKAPM